MSLGRASVCRHHVGGERASRGLPGSNIFNSCGATPSANGVRTSESSLRFQSHLARRAAAIPVPGELDNLGVVLDTLGQPFVLLLYDSNTTRKAWSGNESARFLTLLALINIMSGLRTWRSPESLEATM